MSDYSRYDSVVPWSKPQDADECLACWRRAARALAEWVMATQVIRTDGYGRYRSEAEMAKLGTTCKIMTVRGILTLGVLKDHFRATRREHIIGPLTIVCDAEPEEPDGGESCWCQMVAWDIDAHDGDDKANPIGNHRFAIALYDRALKWGRKWGGDEFWTPLLTDSNGKGGFHLRMMFDRPVLSAQAQAFGKWLARDHADFGVPRPEVFPKQAFPTGKRIGGWLRLPGRHHSHPHWSRVWNGEEWLDSSRALAFILCDHKFLTGFEPLPETDEYVRRNPSKVAEMNWTGPEEKAPRAVAKTREQVSKEVFDLELVKDALLHYKSADLTYPEIFAVGAALWGLGETGWDIWVDWLCADPNPRWAERGYDENTWLSAWQGMDGSRTIGSIFYIAAEHGWNRRERARVVNKKKCVALEYALDKLAVENARRIAKRGKK